MMLIKKNINIAIVHDSFTNWGGAEQVLFRLIKNFPKADIYTSIINHKYLKKLQNNSSRKIFYAAFFSKFTFLGKWISLFKPLILIYWQHLNLNKYDLIISSSHSFSAKSVKTQKKQLHLSYIHTSPRYLYNEFNELAFIKKFPLNYLLKPMFDIMRKNDYQAAQNPDVLIANSKTTQQRIKKYYQRNSFIINPPVATKHSPIKFKKRDQYLFFSRLVKQKGGRLAISVFNKLKKKLVIVGTGSEKKDIKKWLIKTLNSLVF